MRSLCPRVAGVEVGAGRASVYRDSALDSCPKVKTERDSLSRVRLFATPDCSLPGSSIHGVLQARILEWVAVLFSRGSSQPSQKVKAV